MSTFEPLIGAHLNLSHSVQNATFISIIIPTKNREAVLHDTLSVLQNGQPYPLDFLEVNVINDGDPFQQDFNALFPKLNLRISPNRGSGAAAAKNTGIAKASHDMLFFMDDDMLLRGDHINQHLQVHEKMPNVLVGGHWENSPKLVDLLNRSSFGRYKLKTDYHILTGVEVNRIDHELFYTNSVAGFNLTLRKEVMLEIGGFNENFPFTGHEDREFSIRAMRKGYKLIYHTKAMLYHNEFDRFDMQNWLNRKSRGQIGFIILAAVDKEKQSVFGLRQHLPIQAGDGLSLILRKLSLRLLATSPIIALQKALVWLLEKTLGRAAEKLLHQLYKSLYMGYAHNGIIEGQKHFKKLGKTAFELLPKESMQA